MRLPSHLARSRHGIFYFRVVIPLHLRLLFGGQREIKRSLATRDPKTAKIWAYSLYVAFQSAIEGVRKTMSGYDPKNFNLNDPSTWPQKKDVSEFKVKLAARDFECTLDIDPDKAGDAEAARQFMQDTLVGDLKLSEVFKQAATTPNPTYVDAKQTASIVQTAVKKAVSGLSQTGVPTSGLKLGDAIEGWKKDFLTRNRNTKTQSSYFSVLQRFFSFVGNIAVNSITTEHIRDYRNSRKNEQNVGLSTVDGNTNTLGKFFEWAKREGHYPDIKLPTEGQIALSKQERQSQAKGAEAFTLDELKKIFEPVEYRKCNSKPHEHWLPLMALFTGARIEELAQLHLNDIYYQQGVLIFDLNDFAGKRMKTGASKRKVPVHSELVELGLLEYLEDVKKTLPHSERLFPYLTPTKHGRLSDRASKHWGYYLDKCEIIGREKVFHSFRDTVNNNLADYGVTMELRCALVGHDINHVNVKSYRDAIAVNRLLNEGIIKIRYERVEANGSVIRLDLSPLKCHKEHFVERLKECVEEERKQRAILANKTMRANAQQDRIEKQKRRPGRTPG